MGCKCFIPRTSSAYLCQRGHGRELRQPWAFLYIFPHVTEFLRLLLLSQQRARDDKCCHPCVTSSLHIQGTNPALYLLYLSLPIPCWFLCMHVCVSPLHGLRGACQGHRASIHTCSFVDIPAQRRKRQAADAGAASSFETGPSGAREEPPPGQLGSAGAFGHCPPAPVPCRAAGSHSCATMEAQQAPLGTKPNLRDTGAEKALPKKDTVKSSWMPCVRGYPICPPAV